RVVWRNGLVRWMASSLALCWAGEGCSWSSWSSLGGCRLRRWSSWTSPVHHASGATLHAGSSSGGPFLSRLQPGEEGPLSVTRRRTCLQHLHNEYLMPVPARSLAWRPVRGPPSPHWDSFSCASPL